jgi:hypothetical protein
MGHHANRIAGVLAASCGLVVVLGSTRPWTEHWTDIGGRFTGRTADGGPLSTFTAVAGALGALAALVLTVRPTAWRAARIAVCAFVAAFVVTGLRWLSWDNSLCFECWFPTQAFRTVLQASAAGFVLVVVQVVFGPAARVGRERESRPDRW